MCPACESGAALLLQAVGAGALRQVHPSVACIVQPFRLLEPGLHVHLAFRRHPLAGPAWIIVTRWHLQKAGLCLPRHPVSLRILHLWPSLCWPFRRDCAGQLKAAAAPARSCVCFANNVLLTLEKQLCTFVLHALSGDAADAAETALDSWDQLRQLAVAALARMPAPLPGLQEPAQVEGVLCWARSLLYSPRQREADAGVPGG